MTSKNSRNDTLNGLGGLLGDLHRKGVKLWSERGALRYRAKKGLLTPDDLARLDRSRQSIVALLESTRLSVDLLPDASTGVADRRAPLSYTQLAHWNVRHKTDGRPIRQIASASRLLGILRTEVLQESIAIAVRRHDALRTRIVICDGVPMQELKTENGVCLEVINLEALPPHLRGAEIQRQVESAILDASDYATSPLFVAVLLRFDADEHVLILAMEHIISDGFSLNLLFGEITSAYKQLLRGSALELPVVATQFHDYARRQRSAQRGVFEDGWRKYKRTIFPSDSVMLGSQASPTWHMARLFINRNLQCGLRQWAHLHRTTPVMAVFAAYAALVLRWCSVGEATIQFMTDGRNTPDIENSIGYFAFPHYVNVGLSRSDSFMDLLRTVIEQYCLASDRADLALAHAYEPRPDFTRSTTFNWLPVALPQVLPRLEGTDGLLICSRIEFRHPLLDSTNLDMDYDPAIVLSDREDGVAGELWFPSTRFSQLSMGHFARGVNAFLDALVRTPSAAVHEVDFH